MANLKNIALSFLDGFSPLDSLFGGIERPGSRDNLIDNSSYPPLQEVARKQMIARTSGVSPAAQSAHMVKEGIDALVRSLRTKASEIEDAERIARAARSERASVTESFNRKEPFHAD